MGNKKIPNLHRPIKHEINGHIVELLTIGHIAKSVHRSRNAVLYWERVGLLPCAPYRLYPNESSANRRLYPKQFVLELAEIGKKDYLYPRLEYEYWDRFQKEVMAAFEKVMRPLRRGGLELVGGATRENQTEPTE